MHFTNTAVLSLATAGAVTAFDLSSYSNRALESIKRFVPTVTARASSSCPAFWTNVTTDLTTMYVGSDGQCNDDARATIRAAFHDCGTWDTTQGSTGGCDGSLILAQEYNRPENNGLQDISAKLLNLRNTKYPLASVADFIQFAASVAIVSCPGGPRQKTYVGRVDSSNPAPDGLLPDVHSNASVLFTLFQNKGFNAVDLAALVGAHSTSKQFFVDTSAANVGKPQDSTPGLWDINFYAQTVTPPSGTFVFPSDANLAKDTTLGVGKEFKGFVNNKGKWNGKFSDA
jgi:hypothetical protein